jgi:spermidine/putrescine transport system permease protein
MSAVAAAGVDVDRGPLRVKRRRWTWYILPVFTIVMIVYLASPVLMMIVFSFNVLRGQERQVADFTCCTLEWWSNPFAVQELNEALGNSIKVAVPAALIATAIGALIGLVLGRYRFRGRGLTNFVIFLAIAIPEIVLAAALLSMFVQARAPIGYGSILFSHIGFSIAFVAITVRARVQGLDRSLENAAQDLFATPFQAFMRVTLPLIMPGVVAGFLLAFVLSLDDFVITQFTGGPVDTFPTWVFGASRIGVPPQVNVWGTILFLAGVFTAGLNLVSSFRAARRSDAAAESASAAVRGAAAA